MGILIDSTIFIEAERSRLAASDLLQMLLEHLGDVELSISVISAAELLHGCWRAETAARRARREEYVESILGAVPVAAVTLRVARIFAEVDARLRARGEVLPTSDLLIGSTALSRDDELVTGNRRHFDRIPGLRVRDPPRPQPAGRRRS